jgi:hypothetical protein
MNQLEISQAFADVLVALGMDDWMDKDWTPYRNFRPRMISGAVEQYVEAIEAATDRMAAEAGIPADVLDRFKAAPTTAEALREWEGR